MLYLFAGDDAKRKISAYEKFMTQFAEVQTFFISRNNFDRMQIESLYSGAGLFFAKCVVVLEGILEREEAREFLLDKLPLLHESGNIFIFTESKLDKETLDAFKKARVNPDIFELPKEKKEKYNNFILANDLGARDKFSLWLHFRQAVDLGVSLEELVGVLFWKAKDMLAKKNFSKFKKEELENIANKISYLLPEARKEGKNDEAVFERFILEVL